MKQSNTSKYAYMAGLIDCDGWIRIVKRNRHSHTNPTFGVQVGLGQKDGRIIDWLYGNFGGAINFNDNSHIYMWRLNSIKAKYVLKRILPFLRYKQKQAKLAIRLQSHIDKGLNISGKRRNIPLSDKEFEIREQLYQEIKQEKKNYFPCSCRD